MYCSTCGTKALSNVRTAPSPAPDQPATGAPSGSVNSFAVASMFSRAVQIATSMVATDPVRPVRSRGYQSTPFEINTRHLDH
jgi:hypothetical protein